MEALLNLYARPLNPEHPVVCLDEKPIQLLSDVRTPKLSQPGQSAKYDYEYRRHHTANVYCIVEPKAGKHWAIATPTRKKPEFAKVMERIARFYPDAKKIHLVLDNLSVHGKRALVETYGAAAGEQLWNRFKLHYTPKHGSWLNQAEIEISLFCRQCLGKDRVKDLPSLRHRAKAWSQRLTRKRLVIRWRFTTRKARKVFHYKRVASLRPDD